MTPEKEAAIKMGREWLEHAPEAGVTNPELAGWGGIIKVCSGCASRILGRGCDLKSLATVPVWKPESITCDLCKEKTPTS